MSKLRVYPTVLEFGPNIGEFGLHLALDLVKFFIDLIGSLPNRGRLLANRTESVDGIAHFPDRVLNSLRVVPMDAADQQAVALVGVAGPEGVLRAPFDPALVLCPPVSKATAVN